jgi:hypothetical protein
MRIGGCGVRSWYWLSKKRCLAAARTRIPNHPAHSLLTPPTTLRSARISCIIHSTRYIHLTRLVFISYTSGVACKSQRSLLCRSLQLPLTSSALGSDVLHSTQISNAQLMFLHLTASEAVFGATTPESREYCGLSKCKPDLYLQHNFCDILNIHVFWDVVRYHVTGDISRARQQRTIKKCFVCSSSFWVRPTRMQLYSPLKLW